MSSERFLSDIAEIVMGQSPSGDTCNEQGIGVPLLNGPTEFGNKHPQPVQFTTDAKKTAIAGDLLFCVRGSTTGRMNWADQQYAIGRGLAAIRGKNGYPNSFVRAVIEANLDNLLVQATGSTFPNVSRDLISALPIQSLDQESAQVIASIVEPLDDRITLLRETNATLEAIAQALFKSWFVDFDPVHAKTQGTKPEGMDEQTAALFPDSFEESELGMVPAGWEVGTLENCCLRVESGGTPKRTTSEYWNGEISWLTSGEVRQPIVFETKETITELGIKESSAKIWETGTTVVAMYGATAGEVCLLAQPSTANQACCGLIPRKDFRTFLFFCVRRESQNLASKSSGSAQQNLNKGLVAGHQVLIPSEQVVTTYEKITGTLLNSWISNEKKAKTLANLRDTLLPRLISGQLRLPDVEA